MLQQRPDLCVTRARADLLRVSDPACAFSSGTLGPNACSLSNPCQLDSATCATGQAAGPGVNANWFCESVIPAGAVPDGAGALCFSTLHACAIGPNACDNTTCVLDFATCASGQAAGSGAAYTCPLSQPPGALPNAAGAYCYDTAAHCASGASSPRGQACGGGLTRGH